MNYDYMLAKEYASEEFEPSDERYWIVVGAYLKGFESGAKGLLKVIDGDRITRVVFFLLFRNKNF